MKGRDERYPDYPLFKGLQRPLEFMGIQGRYIYWAAGSAGGAIVGFVIAYCLAGFVAGLVVLAVHPVCGHLAHHPQAKERPSHQEEPERSVCLCPLEEDMKKEKAMTESAWPIEC